MGFISELLGYPLGWIMWIIYRFVSDYGIAIIVFTFLTKLALFPTGYKQQLSSVRMQALNPKLANLRKQYANNREKLAQEQQKLYAEEGVNPMGSCLPLIVTMIILYGILDVVYRPLTHILRIKDDVITKMQEIIIKTKEWGISADDMKSRPELTILQQVKENSQTFIDNGVSSETVQQITDFKNTFLGIDLGQVPSIKPEVWDSAAIALIMIPIFSCLVQFAYSLYTQYKSKQMNPEMQGAGAMKIMMLIMPLFSLWLAFQVPAGVGFYWIWSSVFSFIQSFALYAYFTPKRVEAINAKLKEKTKNKKPGFMQKMLDQQAQLNQQAKDAQSAGRVDYNAETEKMSKSEKNKYNRELIKEARKRMAEKYGEEYTDDENDND
ncbi:MAG: YidC/Oxa1 family membrane protein insertase [Ruminococcus sp.]|nr:YidC/Oxa1 family membrane protein insertase [Ruminococcus sp.]